MYIKKALTLVLIVAMILSFSTLFISANTRSVSYPQSWVNVGESIQLTVSGVTSVSWATDNSNVATVSATGKVTGVSLGTATITTNCQYANGNSETFTTYITVYDSRGIVNGEEYYILNAEYDNLLSLASSSTANNTDINLSERSTSTTKRWRLTQQSTGMYTIASIYAQSSKGLCANSSASDVSLYTLGSSKTHFEIRRINTIPYKGLYLICYGSKYLAATSSSEVQLTSTLSGKCYWSLSRVDKGNADLFTFDYSNFDSTEQNLSFFDTFETIGYTANYHENATSTTGKNALLADDIFVFNGHYGGFGSGNGSLYFYDDSGTEIGRIVATDNLASSSDRYSIPGLSPNGSNALASLRCVLYLACNTATDYGTTNLVEATYNEGAHFVLGTTSTVDASNSNAFLDIFLDNVNQKNIYSCIAEAQSVATRSSTLSRSSTDYPISYVGDGNQYLN